MSNVTLYIWLYAYLLEGVCVTHVYFFKCFRCDDFYFELFEIEYTCLATSFLSYVLSIKEKQEEPLGRVTMVIDFGREH